MDKRNLLCNLLVMKVIYGCLFRSRCIMSRYQHIRGTCCHCPPPRPCLKLRLLPLTLDGLTPQKTIIFNSHNPQEGISLTGTLFTQMWLVLIVFNFQENTYQSMFNLVLYYKVTPRSSGDELGKILVLYWTDYGIFAPNQGVITSSWNLGCFISFRFLLQAGSKIVGRNCYLMSPYSSLTVWDVVTQSFPFHTATNPGSVLVNTKLCKLVDLPHSECKSWK